MKINHISLWALGFAVAASPVSAAAPAYRLTKLAQPAGSLSSVARAISANGTIAGEGFASPAATGQTPLAFGSVGALATAYTPTITDPATSFVRGVNDNGVAAGTAQSATNGNYNPILTGTGGLTVLTPLAGFSSGGANGINDAGTVAGYSLLSGSFASEGTARPIPGPGGRQVATLWNAGIATALSNPLGNFNSIATAINGTGQVAGVVNGGVSATTNRAVVWTGGIATVLAIGANERSTARAISSDGWVVGRRDNLLTGAYAGNAWAPDGSSYTLGAMGVGCTDSDLRGINASGIVVGFSQQAGCGANGTAGTLWQWNGAGFVGYEINSLVVNLDGWNLFAPQAINDLGQIVGFGTNAQGVNQAFLLTAVPEPSNWAMLIAGFGLVGTIERRRRAATASARRRAA